MFDASRLPANAQAGEPFPRRFWYPIARSSAVASKPVGLRRLGSDLVLWRDEGGILRAAHAACPHRGANLSLGRVCDGQLECPYHGLRFDGEGTCTRVPCDGDDARIPSAMRLNVLPVREEHGFVWWWADAHSEPASTIPWLDDQPALGLGQAEGEMTWDIRYSRVAEQMLDIHHFPFAHRSLGMGAYTRVDPYEARREGRVIRTSGTMRRPSASSGFDFQADALFPASWRLVISGTVLTIVTCPIDGEHAWVGFRYTMPQLRIPLLGAMVAKFMVAIEMNFVQPDDYRMGVSANPRSPFPGDNVYVGPDRGIALWHGLWHAALSEEGRLPATDTRQAG